MTIIGRLAGAAVRLALVLCAVGSTASSAAVIPFDPLLPGNYAAGSGASATFLRIDGNWQGTAVFYNEGLGVYSNTGGGDFLPIRDAAWGTGIWGLADWWAINAPGSEVPLHGWSGVAPTIGYADAEYVGAGYAPTWGTYAPLPSGFFDTGAQDNWTSHFTGYLRITDPGAYNFGVLYDDGFFFRLWGAGDQMLEISSDFLSPRDRLGFANDLLLGTGLYRFELGAYDRLEVGVVDLAWFRDGGWQTIPTQYLVTDPVAVPEPGTAALLLLAVTALLLLQKVWKVKVR